MKQKSKAKGPVFRDADEERKAVRLSRQAVFWTQFDLANATGLSQSKLSLYEGGHVQLGDLERAKIWQAFRRKYEALKKKTESFGAEPNLLSGELSALYPAEWRNAVKEWSTEGAGPD